MIRNHITPRPSLTIHRPAIIVLDSLGSSHTTETRFLKEYISAEGLDKKNYEFPYTMLQGVTARGIPQQTNSCDCGVYLIGYMEAFLRDPRQFVRKVFTRELDLHNDFSDFDPAEKRAQIRDLLLELGETQKQDKKAKKKEAHLAKKASEMKLESQAATPALRSSPVSKPKMEYESSRMAQSSPVKGSPPEMRKSEEQALPQSSPPVEEDEMLFNASGQDAETQDADTQVVETEDAETQDVEIQDPEEQAARNSFDFGEKFTQELLQAAEHGNKAEYQED